MSPSATSTMILAALALGLSLPAAAQDADYAYAQSGYDTDGQPVDSIGVFFEPLSRYGRWLDSRYGRVWSPNVPRNWRPYTIGHWEEGAFGQTWRSDEPFGWAVFHFGRWAFDPAIGWVWSPDTVWGPGWVAWRDSDEVTGWSPLPPQIDLAVGGYGFNDWGYDQWYQPGWVYVPRGYLYARSLRGIYLPAARNRDFWGRTRGVTRYDRVDGAVVNRSFGFRGGQFGGQFQGQNDGRRDGRGGDRRREADGRPDFGSRPDLRGGQAYGGQRNGYIPTQPFAAPRAGTVGAPPRGFGDRDGFVPGTPPRGFGGRDGFVPGAPPRGFERRPASPPVVGLPTGRPVPSFMPPPMARPQPAPMPRPAPPPVRTREANPNERPR